MEVEVQARNLSDASIVRQHASRRMWAALGRFRHSVHAVSVRLGDVNGPRGGADKLCRIVVRLKNSSRVVIEELGEDVFRVIDKVADRAHQSVSRQLGRAKRRGRGDPLAVIESGPVPVPA
jgi:putative sigma-54 modulation protein